MGNVWLILAIFHFSCMEFCFGGFHCRGTQSGVDYSGSQNEAFNGKTCLRWSDVLGSSQTEFVYHMAETDINSAENFCRNPTNDPSGPWCYVQSRNSEILQQSCNVPYCANTEHCKTSALGKEYKGSRNFTATGKVCQRWDSQSPHGHSRNNINNFPDGTLSETANFCRNPDSVSGGPWCYTVDPLSRWEYCGIPFCDNTFGIGSITLSFHSLVTDTLTDGDLESCQQLFSPSAKDFELSIEMTKTWESVNIEFAFNSVEVKSCRDYFFYAYYAETDNSCSSTCGSLTLCQWIEVSTDIGKGFCRFSCSCSLHSCQSVTLTVPSQLGDFELCEVRAWSE